VREKSAVLLDVSDLPAQQHGWLGADVLVTYSDLTAQWLYESIKAPQQCGFARSAFADERNSATSRNVHAYIIQCYYGSEAVRDIPGGEERRHALKTVYGGDFALCLPRASTITR
jgi:hypothetical protein